jgi:hypothetical protein
MDPKLFRFQVDGGTEREVETFMTTASAIDVVIEEWDYTCKSTQEDYDFFLLEQVLQAEKEKR